MTKISASEAKTHFGALIDNAQREPITIEKQGRPVAVVLSFEAYTEQLESTPSDAERKSALQFLKKWAMRPPHATPETALEGDVKAQAIWDKYSHTS